MAPEKFPEGSGGGVAMADVACVRAIDSYMKLIELADRLCEAMDDTTIPGVVRAPIKEDDSLVIAIQHAKSVGGTTK